MRRINSEVLPDHISPMIRVIIEASDVKDPLDALMRPFLMGEKVFNGYKSTVIWESALTDEKITERCNDPRWCKFCLLYVEKDGHDVNVCRLSPWREEIK